jgi:hypothetical protein
MVFLKGQGPACIQRLEQRYEQIPVSNLAVTDLHNFAVGEAAMLVHNQSGTFPQMVSGEIRGMWQKQLQNGTVTEEQLTQILHPEDVKEIVGNLEKKLNKRAGTHRHDQNRIIDSAKGTTDAATRAAEDLAAGRITQEEFDRIMKQEAELLKAQERYRRKKLDD